MKTPTRSIIIVGTALASAAASAPAALIQFDNTAGVYDWMVTGQGIGSFPGTYLDLTLPPTQPEVLVTAGPQGPSQIGKVYTQGAGSLDHWFGRLQGLFARGGTATGTDRNGNPLTLDYPRLFTPGESVGPGPAYASNLYYQSNRVDWAGEGVEGYYGVRFQLGADTHYGWVRLDYAQNPANPRALAWAYEDAADTPAIVPAPAGAAMAAAGLVAALRRRRR